MKCDGQAPSEANNEEKRRFPFLEIYWEECEFIPPESKLSFLQAVIEYGLYKTEPDFSEEVNSDFLKSCFHHVRKFIERSWTYRKNGQNGGAPLGNKNASKKKKTTKKLPKTTNE